MQKKSNAIKEPFFLVGAERSGTTLLRLMLDSHPQLAWCSEFEFAVQRLPEEGGWPAMEDYHAWLPMIRVFRHTGFTVNPSLSYPELMNSFLHQCKDRAGKEKVGATVHYDFHKLPRIWPDAKYIHILRDGRDVARSCIGMGWAGNVYTGADIWIEAEETWKRLCATLPKERWTEVTYEELVRDAPSTLERLCAFIGLPYDPAMLAYQSRTTYEAPDPKLIAQWKRKMSEREVQLVEARIAPMLVERGYELSGYPIIEVSTSEDRELRREDRRIRLRNAFKKYGVWLIGAGYVARRLKLGFLARMVNERRQIIDEAHLK